MEKDAPENLEREFDPSKIPISDGFILAALPVFSYIFHYFFEFGYLSYFDIPTAFISFNLTEIIPAIFFLVAAYFTFLFGLWPLLSRGLAVFPGPVRTLLLFAPWLPIFAFLGFSWDIILIVFLCLLLLYAAERSRTARARKTVERDAVRPAQPPASGQAIPVSGQTKSALDSLVSKILPVGNMFLVFYFLFFALVGSIALGRITALTRSTFPITDATPNCAVVYNTATRYICKPFSGSTFDNSFKIYYTEESQNLEYREEEIGPLKPAR